MTLHTLSGAHEEYLSAAAITGEIIEKAGVVTLSTDHPAPEGLPEYWGRLGPGILFPWHGPEGSPVLWQFRPDTPPEEGKKYLFPKGCELRFSRLAEPGEAMPVILAEGTKQHLAVASHAPEGWGVYGIAGCWGWTKEDLSFLRDRQVYVIFDADMSGNRDVHDAAERLKEALETAGAASCQFARVPGGAREGIDDVLARIAPDQRRDVLARILGKAESKLGRKPARKVNHPFFSDEGLKAEELSRAIFAKYPSALTTENSVAIYEDGVYRISPLAYSGAVGEFLGDLFRPAHRQTAEEFTKGVLYRTGRVLPERMAEPVLNVANGMLDLLTGTLKPHDPAYLSYRQVPVEWDPEAQCPVYEEWLAAVAGDQGPALEEAVSMMLDPSRTPTKAVFLFGPSRSGKSTFLRLMCAIAGRENTSAVTLHELSEDQFATANLYGKILNCAADLSASDVSDLSRFKMMTGEDASHANRKYGQQFTFTNQALFAFSANELPVVSEGSRAYLERIRPFKFASSFAGSENPALEEAMARELPGILARWVRAWQGYRERGDYLPMDVTVRHEFEVGSDRVRQWLSEMCTVVSVVQDQGAETRAIRPGMKVPPGCLTPKRDLSRSFAEWAKINNGPAIGERKFIARLASIAGVFEVRSAADSQRGLNIRLSPGGVPVETGPEADGAEGAVSSPIVLWGGTQNFLGNPNPGDATECKEESKVTLPTFNPPPKVSSPETAPSAFDLQNKALTCGNPGADYVGESAPESAPDPLVSATGHFAPALMPLFDALRPYVHEPCPSCGGDQALVPPSLFWYACPACNPSTFGAPS